MSDVCVKLSDVYVASYNLESDVNECTVTIGEESRCYINSYIAGSCKDFNIICIRTNYENIEWLKNCEYFLADCNEALCTDCPDVYANIVKEIIWL